MNDDRTKLMSENSAILYGVPKVGYGVYGCTPLPICLKACANYLGQDISYEYAMVASGSAFRLVWDTTCWNGGNVDVILTYDNPTKIYQTGVNALGWKYNLLGRSKETKKEDFIKFIKEQIDNGLPCIAIGIIGPPEACIITGYRNNGETLLGWNFFQDSPENGGSVGIDESGYFISESWWDNQDTVAVMSIGEMTGELFTIKDITDNAISVLTGRKKDHYAKGILAYDAWRKALSNDKEFPENAILPILIERLMCQGDAMDCLSDGRYNASRYFESLAKEKSEHQKTFKSLANNFKTVYKNMYKMSETLGGWERNEQQMRNLATRGTRERLIKLIDESKAADMKALENLKILQKNL